MRSMPGSELRCEKAMGSIAEPGMNRPRVLVVDDSASTCLLIASSLQRRGYEVDIALNGQDGLTKAMTFHPYCLILDVLMPGISGYAICRYLRQRFQQQMPYIILISTKDTPLDRYYGLLQGADSYLPKPFTEEALLQAVWEGIPTSVRRAVSPVLSSTPPRPALWELIPRRIPNTETMRSSSPFARSTVTEDERARRLYMAIDGRKTVAELAAINDLKTKDVSHVLRILLQEHSIELYDSAGQFVEMTFESASAQRNEAPSWRVEQ
jgi:DNA-binding response OmpR family regulator